MPQPGFEYFSYQKTGAAWLSQRKAAILADELGVGKTPCAILAADLVQARTILVVCPGIARENWKRELERWQDLPRRIGIIKTSSLLPETDVVIVSQNAIISVRVLTYLLRRDWDVLIVDEAHSLKNSAAKRTIACFGDKTDGKNGLVSKSKYIWILSGTLMPNDPSELWSHCHALFPDVSQGLSYDHWVHRYCVKAQYGERIIGANARTTPQLATLLRPHVLRRLTRDVQKHLPPLRLVNVPVLPDHLPPRSQEIVETEAIVRAAMARNAKGQTEEARRALAEVSTIHIASLRRWTGLAKAPAVVEQIRDDFTAGMDRVVIFAVHQAVILTLMAGLPGSVGIYGNLSKETRAEWPDAQNVPDNRRQYLIDAFEGRVPGYNPKILVCSIEIASTALTLVSSANVAFAETTWVPKDVQQAMKRCHREGQTRSVLARIFSLSGSVDDTISEVLARKARVINQFNTALAG